MKGPRGYGIRAAANRKGVREFMAIGRKARKARPKLGRAGSIFKRIRGGLGRVAKGAMKYRTPLALAAGGAALAGGAYAYSRRKRR